MRNQIFYVLSMTCLILGVGLISFVLFLVPFIFLHINYDIPTFLAHVSAWLREEYGIMGHYNQAAIFLLPPLILGIVFVYLAWIFGNLYDRRELRSELHRSVPFRVRPLPDNAPIREDEKNPPQHYTSLGWVQSKRSIIHPLILHLSLITIILILLFILEWLIITEF